MFTDLVGFTKLGQRDEEEALRLRKEHQSILRPLFAAHGGREVKTLGDGFLVEFSSAVESVRCAVAIQGAIGDRNALVSATTPLVLRVGIHVGDIVEEAGDIVGDAVNVASRIEPLAEPGGICITGSVFDQVRNKVDLPLEKLAARGLKNVEYPVDVYRVVLAKGASPPTRPRLETSASNRVAVLPFSNLSPDSRDAYFADGLTDELIVQVAKIPSLRVISRTSVFRYKEAAKSIREVGQELGVRWAVEGSVRKAGDRLRITAQLVDTGSEEQLWTARYDRPFDDIFSIQDDIAGQIASSISGHLSRLGATTLLPFVRGSPDTANLEAYANFLHGRKLLGERGSEATMRTAVEYFETAVRLDPEFARARVGLAECLMWLSSEGALPQAETEERARHELETALAQDDTLAEAHSALAGMHVGADHALRAEREARRAIELNPSLSDPYRWLAQLAAGAGRIDEAIRLLEAAQQVDPADVNVLAFLGRLYFYSGRDADALAHIRRVRPLVEFRSNAHLAEHYLGVADYRRAEEAIREMERLRPESTWTEAYRGYLAARMGDVARARRALEALDKRATTGEMTVIFQAYVHLALGEMDAVARCMEAAFEVHSLPLLELMYSPLYEPARKDPRILDLLQRQSELGTAE
jgi:adenylate cyclase